MNNMVDEQKAISLLRYAEALYSQSYNTVKNMPPVTRRAMVGAREHVVKAIGSIILLVGTARGVEEKDAIESTYNTAITQLQFSLAILKLDFPKETGRIESDLQTNSFLLECFNCEYSKGHAQAIIVKIERVKSRREALILRCLISEYLVRSSAAFLGLNSTRTVGEFIRREIRFPPELKQAGIGILSYFQQIITTKYPDMDVGISIEQRGDRVILTIETPSGDKERIERELHEYGLVVIGQTRPEDYLPSPIDVVRLKHHLELAELETRQVRELLYSERSQYENRIKALESHTELLRDVLDHDRYLTRKLTEDIAQMAITSSTSVTHLIKELTTLIQNEPNAEREQEFAHAIVEIKSAEPSLIVKLEELLLKGAIQGAAGNYLYAWLQILSRLV